jgi:hypothetical protein
LRAWRRPTALAAVLYLLLGLWAHRAILADPRQGLPYPVSLQGSWLSLSLGDEQLTAALTARNAHQFLTAPWNLFDNGQCWPTADSTALGEHMFGMGLLGIVPYALTHDPVLTLNVVALEKIWLAGMAMFALVAYWTGNPAAALLAGLLFACQPPRLTNPMHAYVEANEWTPLALLAAHHLFTRGSWRAAGALAAAMILQMLESIYPVIALAIIGGIYGAYLAVLRRRHWRLFVPKVLAVVAVVATVAAAVYVPYFRLKGMWNALGGRTATLFGFDAFEFGGQAYAGTVAVLLAAFARLDRLRRRRDEHGYDPRWILVVGGFVALATSTDRIPLPFGASLPSLFTLAVAIVPGLDAIRGAAVIGRGVALVMTFLAGYGVLALCEGRSSRVRVIAVASLAVAALAEVFVPALAARSFGAPVTMAANDVRPSAALLALYDQAPDGPILDLPFTYDGRGIMFEMPHYVFLGAYHRHPVGACYNSFILQVQHDIEALATRVPERDAVDALAAIGFRSVVVHDELLGRTNRRLAPLAGVAAATHPPDPAQTHATLVAQADSHSLYALAHEAPVATTFAALASPEVSTTLLTARPPTLKLNVVFTNRAAEIFRHPEPIAPDVLLVRWYAASGALTREDRVRVLLPLALAPGQAMVRPITIPVAVAPGEYQVTLAPAATPDVVLTRQPIRLDDASPG